MMKLYLYEPNVLRNLKKYFGNLDEMNEIEFKTAITSSFPSFLTDFELKFLRNFLPVASLSNRSLSLYEDDSFFNPLISQQPITSHKIYRISALQRVLSEIESTNLVLTEKFSKYSILNALALALEIETT